MKSCALCTFDMHFQACCGTTIAMMIYYYAEHYAVSIIDKIVPVTIEVMSIRFIYINIRLLRAVRIRK